MGLHAGSQIGERAAEQRLGIFCWQWGGQLPQQRLQQQPLA